MSTIISRRTIGGFPNRFLFACDLILLPIMIYSGAVLLLDTVSLQRYFGSSIILAGLTFLLTPPIFVAARLYSRHWPSASVEELTMLLAAIAALTGAIGLSLLAVTRLISHPLSGVPGSILFVFFLLPLPAALGPRLVVRLIATFRPRGRLDSTRERVLVVGADATATMIVRELQRAPQLGMTVVGFLDDDPAKRRMGICGVPVLGTRDDLPAIVRSEQVTRVIIAMSAVSGRVIREIVRSCEQVGVRAQMIPGFAKLIDGTISFQHLRDVELEDLLRREPIRTDLTAVTELLRGKRVLITGAGGSIGSELARQVLRCRPSALVLVGHGENSIFAIHNELSLLLQADRQSTPTRGIDAHDQTVISPVIADVRFPDRLIAVFDEHRPEVVFHAAAHKHVPLMEANPAEAILNNIIGTRNTLGASVRVGVERFVLISTDKAVNPTSVMGASKRAAELLVHQTARATGKPYMVLRFGNVLGSRGSVVPTMKQQIARGGPVTVTHAEITRFFITIPEAVQLVLHAGTLGHGGEVFVLDMGEPVKIINMARDLIRLSGLEVGHDIDIVITGLRPGEKLYEELFIAGEDYRRTRHHKIFIASNAGHLIPADLSGALARLEHAAQAGDPARMRAELRRLLPEFAPEGTGTSLATQHIQAHEPLGMLQLPAVPARPEVWSECTAD